MAPVPTTSQEAFPAIRTSLQSMTQADASSQPPSALFEPSPLRGRQRVSSSVSLLEEPHASLISPARRRAGMNVMIPMGGLGSRFKSDGYRHPKPLINIFGRPMIMWLIDKLSLTADDTLWVAHMEHIEEDFHLAGQLKKEYVHLDVRYVPLNFETRGAAETLYIVCQAMTDSEASRPTLSLDCDTLYFSDILAQLRQVPAGSGAVVHFKDTGNRAIYSYIQYDEASRKITDIREKVRISDHANTGAYMFSDAILLRTFLNKFLDGAVDSAGEYYTSSIIHSMLLSDLRFEALPIDNADFFCIGTPKQLKDFLNYLHAKPELIQPRRFCFDLDCTLVTLPVVAGDYTTVKPIEPNIKMLRQLKKSGHYIIIHTARRMRTHNGDVSKVIADVGEITKNTLRDFESTSIPYDELCFGKPYAHLYIDDLAVHAHLDTHKEIGLCLPDDESSKQAEAKRKNVIIPRSFNDVQIVGRHVVKSSRSKAFAGEVYFYKNMPPAITQHIATLISTEEIATNGAVPSTVLTLEKIDGPTFSHLVTSRCLTAARFGRLLDVLAELHQYQPSSSTGTPAWDEGVDVYSNYAQKITSRFQADRDVYLDCQSAPKEAEKVYQYLVKHLQTYQDEKRAKHVHIVHGDPVFSNVLLDKNGHIRLIDMRGKIGETLTLEGDATYDLAKVYQSLCGYDHILIGRSRDSDMDARMLEGLRKVFFDFVKESYPEIREEDIFLVTASLYFSLIPLHVDVDHHKQFMRSAVALLQDHGMTA